MSSRCGIILPLLLMTHTANAAAWRSHAHMNDCVSLVQVKSQLEIRFAGDSQEHTNLSSSLPLPAPARDVVMVGVTLENPHFVGWSGRGRAPKLPPQGSDGLADLILEPDMSPRTRQLPGDWVHNHDHKHSIWHDNAGPTFPFPHDYRDPNKAWSNTGRWLFLLAYTLLSAAACLLVHFWPQVQKLCQPAPPAEAGGPQGAGTKDAAVAEAGEVTDGPTPLYDAQGLVVDWFVEVAAKSPSSVAVLSPAVGEGAERALTYAELAAAIDELSGSLMGLGVVRGSIAALILERSIGQVVAVFAVLKAGAGFLPIGADLPMERQRFMLEESGARAVIAYSGDKAAEELAAGAGAATVAMPTDGSLGQLAISPAPSSSPGERATPTSSDTALLIYTSGTTGTPKGIVYDHRHLTHGVWSFSYQCEMDATSVGLLKSPYFWAIIEWELFPALTRGGKLVVASADGHKNPQYLASTTRSEEVSVLMLTPTVLDLIMDLHDAAPGDELLGPVKHIVTVGEPLTSALANRVVGGVRAQLHNFYGASESSCTVYTVPREGVNLAHFPSKAPVGLPQPHAKVFVMKLSASDGAEGPLRRAEPGEAGEICFGGVLAARYWKKEELTKQKWVDSKFGRLYRSGDMGRWRHGVLEVIGRTDRQVKIRGVRIEPEEIEAVLKRFAADGAGLALREVAVVATKEPCELVAFASKRDGAGPVSQDDLRAHCKASLTPAYVPKYFVVLESLPLLPNGKVNLAELKQLANKHAEEEGEVVMDSMGQMKQMSKSALLETAIIHRCYAWWMVGVLSDHFCRCAMDVDVLARPAYKLYGFCTSLASPSVQPWTEIVIRSLGNDQDMFGFIMLGAYQDSRPGRDGASRVNFGWRDLYMFGVYMAVGFPVPQFTKILFGPSTWPIYWMGDPAPTNMWDASYMNVNSHVGGHRWYLWMVLGARLYMAICEKLRIPGWVQTVLCFVPCFIPIESAWDICKAIPSDQSALEYLAAWVLSASGGECAVYYRWVQWYVAFYVLSFHAIRPFLKRTVPYLPQHRTYGAVALSISFLIGLLMAMFHYPSTALEGEATAAFSSIMELLLTIFQPALFVYGVAQVPLDLAWWGNTTLGCYVFHFFFRDQFSIMVMCLADLLAWDVTGILLIVALPALFILFTTVMGPIGHYALIAPSMLNVRQVHNALTNVRKTFGHDSLKSSKAAQVPKTL